MPKYWGKQIFTHRRFPEVGQKQKTEKTKQKKERPATSCNTTSGGARKAAWAQKKLDPSLTNSRLFSDQLDADH